jgi:hypothetical protein
MSPGACESLKTWSLQRIPKGKLANFDALRHTLRFIET